MAGEPMYRVIADDLRRQIEAGELRAGVQLKTEVELREEYGRADTRISRTTVRDAIKLLVARGLVETRPGQGTFVLGRNDPFVSKLAVDPAAGGLEDKIYSSEVERQGRVPDETRPRVEVQPPLPAIAQSLGLKGDDQVVSRHQQRKGCYVVIRGPEHRRRSGRLSPWARHRSGRMARPVHPAATGRE